MEKIINYTITAILFICVAFCLYLNNIFTTNLYPVEINGKYGFINKSGKEVLDIKYDDVIDSGEKLIAVYTNNKWGFINKKGEMKIEPQYVFTSGFKKGLAYVYDDTFEGYIDYNGKYVWKQAIVKTQMSSETAAADEVSNTASAPKTESKPIKNDFADEILKEMGL